MKRQDKHYNRDKGKEVKKRYRKPARFIKGVDFQRIEDAPLNRFEKEVQEKIAVQPEALNNLIQEEQRAMLSEALEHAGLSDSERLCIELILEGFKPIQIARKLGIGNSLAHYYLGAAKRKISAYIRTKYGSFEGEI